MDEERLSRQLLHIYHTLFAAYGPQGWWPGESAFEVVLGAVLTQNTAWGNVERALENLKAAGVLSLRGLQALKQEELERLLRPSGTYRVKATRVRALLDYLERTYGGNLAGLAAGDLEAVRRGLLSVPGIGPETADSILLYAAGRPTFVIDAYTRRLVGRLGLVGGNAPYEKLRAFFMEHLPPDPALYGEYHALIVRHGKEHCRARRPQCDACPLLLACAYARGALG